MDGHSLESRDVYSNLGELGPTKFSFEDLKTATNNFNITYELGNGASGSVFKGNLKDGTIVAVKKMDDVQNEGRQYIAEVEAIAPVKHIHLVRLRGYCTHKTSNMGTTFYVVYDYLPTGSLDKWIFNTKDTGVCLSWKLRYRVALEIAKVLIYLHHDCGEPRIHLDIKPANILLDEDFHAVLSDFGMSKVMKTGNSVDNIIRGTLGYIAPEWFHGDSVSVKFDMFSYGKLLLDLFFGKSYVCLNQNGNDVYKSPGGNSENEWQICHDFMLKEIEGGTIKNYMDSGVRKMNEEVNEREVICLVHAALSCIQGKPENRPGDMKEVFDILEGKNTWDFSPPDVPVHISSTPQQDRFPASRENTKKKVIEALLDDKTSLVGVYGMGGVGKTTLVKQVREEVEKIKIFNKVVLVSVSQNFDLGGLQTVIAESLGMKFEVETVEVRASRLSERLKQEKKILLILDNAWKRLELVDVGIVPGRVGEKICKVIITSRSSNVCGYMKATSIVEVAILSYNDSLELFRQEVGDADFNVHRKLSETIVRKCDGLPLAIVTLARALKGKDKGYWEAVIPQLQNSKFEGMSHVNASIRLSYNFIEANETKLCFLLCSLFPEDHKITMDTLIGYAMGEDLLGDGETLREARGNLHIMIDTLASSGLLLKGYDVRNKIYVTMHDIIRDTAITIAREENNKWMLKAGLGLKRWPKVGTGNSLRMSLMSNHLRKLPDRLECFQLVALSLSINWGIEIIPIGFFEGMDSLATLDLSRTGIHLLPQSFSCLNNCLRSLFLDNCSWLQDVSIIGNLKTLEILSLSGTGILKLPEELKGLTELKMLNLSENWNLRCIPPNVISSLSNLEELYIINSFSEWEVGEIGDTASNACLEELSSLDNLTSLHLVLSNTKLLSENIRCPWENINDICINVLLEEGDEEISAECITDRYVALRTRKNSYPLADWVMVLFERAYHLVLNLDGCEGVDDVVQLNLKGFNHLKSLKIENGGTTKYVVDMDQKIISGTLFTELETLDLRCSKELLGIWNRPCLERTLGKLKVLSIQGCPNFIQILPWLWKRLQNLEILKIVNCGNVKEIFGSEGIEEKPLNVAKLTYIRLDSLPSLTSIWKGDVSFLRLENLKILNLTFCHSLDSRYLFISLAFVQTFHDLEELRVSYCKSFIGLIKEDEKEEITIKSSSSSRFVPQLPITDKANSSIIIALPKTPIFYNLKKLNIKSCNGLRYIFSVGVLRGLVQLEKMKITRCEELKGVAEEFQMEEDEEKEVEEQENVNIQLPHLRTLKLRTLPKLSSFFSQSRRSPHFLLECPSLETLMVLECPTLKRLPFGLLSTPKLDIFEVDDNEWFEQLKWEDPSVKLRLQLALKNDEYQEWEF